MLRIALLACLLTVSLAFRAELDSEWTAYKQTYTKVYQPHEEYLRYGAHEAENNFRN